MSPCTITMYITIFINIITIYQPSSIEPSLRAAVPPAPTCAGAAMGAGGTAARRLIEPYYKQQPPLLTDQTTNHSFLTLYIYIALKSYYYSSLRRTRYQVLARFKVLYICIYWCTAALRSGLKLAQIF